MDSGIRASRAFLLPGRRAARRWDLSALSHRKTRAELFSLNELPVFLCKLTLTFSWRDHATHNHSLSHFITLITPPPGIDHIMIVLHIQLKHFQRTRKANIFPLLTKINTKNPKVLHFPTFFFHGGLWKPRKVKHFWSQPSKAELAKGLKDVCPPGKVNFVRGVSRAPRCISPLLASVLFDDSERQRPHTFYPAHFLDEEGKFVKRDAFLPFSAGLWVQMWLPVKAQTICTWWLDILGFCFGFFWWLWATVTNCVPSLDCKGRGLKFRKKGGLIVVIIGRNLLHPSKIKF